MKLMKNLKKDEKDTVLKSGINQIKAHPQEKKINSLLTRTGATVVPGSDYNYVSLKELESSNDPFFPYNGDEDFMSVGED